MEPTAVERAAVVAPEPIPSMPSVADTLAELSDMPMNYFNAEMHVGEGRGGGCAAGPITGALSRALCRTRQRAGCFCRCPHAAALGCHRPDLDVVCVECCACGFVGCRLCRVVTDAHLTLRHVQHTHTRERAFVFACTHVLLRRRSRRVKT